MSIRFRDTGFFKFWKSFTVFLYIFMSVITFGHAINNIEKTAIECNYNNKECWTYSREDSELIFFSVVSAVAFPYYWSNQIFKK